MDIPASWSVVPLEDLLAEPLANGRSAGNETGEHRILRLTALRNSKVDYTQTRLGSLPPNSEMFRVRAGDALVARGNGSLKLVGRAGIVDREPAEAVHFPDTMIRVRINPSALSSSFFMQVWDSFFVRRQIEATARTTAGIYKISQADIGKVMIPVAPLAEQERIARACEAQLSRIDFGRAILIRAKAMLERYHHSVLAAQLERESSLSWNSVRLADVCTAVQDGTHFSPKEQSNSGDYLYITAKNIKECGLDLSDVTYVPTHVHRSIYSRCNPEKGDVLYIKDGVTAGTATVNSLEEEFSLLSSVALIKPRRDILDPHFLKHYLNSPNGYRDMTGKMSGTAIRRIILEEIRNAEIPLPPLDEQNQIVQEVEQRLTVLPSLEQAVVRSLRKAESLRQAILKKAFAGRLVPQDPNDEPASVLLDRIRQERAAQAPAPRRSPRKSGGKS